jgi:hypothetical protein
MVGRKSIASTKRRSLIPPQVEQRVAGGQPHRTAYVPLKHDSERITEWWTRSGRKADRGPEVVASRRTVGKLLGGISRRSARGSLYRVAKRLGIKDRSAMTKRQLIEAIETTASDKRANRRGH